MGPVVGELKYPEVVDLNGRMLRSLGNVVFSFCQGVIFLLVVLAAVFSVSELAARDTASNLLSSRVTSLRAEFLERVSTTIRRNPVLAKPAALADTKTSAGAAIQAEAGWIREKEQYFELEKIQGIELLRRKLMVLSAVGTNSSQDSLRGIIVDFQEKTSAAVLPPTPKPEEEVGGWTRTFMTFWADLSGQVRWWSSDQLLAMSMMACGAIGAMIAMLRAEGGLSLRIFILGLAAGFITFLAIKGGKHVFILQNGGEQTIFNPYGTAFAGLIAGLFTEKAYTVLSHLVDDLSRRLTGAPDQQQKQTGDVVPFSEKKSTA